MVLKYCTEAACGNTTSRENANYCSQCGSDNLEPIHPRPSDRVDQYISLHGLRGLDAEFNRHIENLTECTVREVVDVVSHTRRKTSKGRAARRLCSLLGV